MTKQTCQTLSLFFNLYSAFTGALLKLNLELNHG